ncbi:L,D-transpeptidase catalytic domain [compost metagenome]
MKYLPTVCTWCATAALLALNGPAWSARVKQRDPAPITAPKSVDRDGRAEAKLVEVYRLVGTGNSHAALKSAQALVDEYPNFQLAQLIYGDLLTSHNRPLRVLGDVTGDLPPDAASRLLELREESRRRLLALKERPPQDTIPAQLLSLSPRNKHAIAVDVSRSRLYLFENTGKGPRLLADYYISVGKTGVDKKIQGDQRTPLGIYFITSNLNPKSLQDLYGSGALPINYPNALDIRQGRSGSGIWLHGTPSNQFSRAPHATDGCVAIANPDLERIIRTVEIRTTPVVIAQNLKWVSPQSMSLEKSRFMELLQSWAKAKSAGELRQFRSFYADDFTADEKTLANHRALNKTGATVSAARNVKLSDISLLQWTEEPGLVVAT